MDIKLNDVYRFRYREEVIKGKFEPYWCFDGQLIVTQNKKRELFLVDTYWGFGNSANKCFTLEKALDSGYLTFICNLDDVEEISEDDTKYYDNQDIFNLSCHHGCRKHYCVKRGANKSIANMTKVIEAKIEKEKFEISWHQKKLKELEDKLKRIELGEAEVYF